MAHISERIKQLRTGAGMTQEEFGKKFGVVKSTVSLYENGKSTPNDQIKIKICEYFGVPLDYLIGISSNSIHINTEKNGGIFLFDFKAQENFEELLKKNNTTREKISQKTGINLEILNNWFSTSTPDLKQLILVADELHTTIDHLLGRVDYSYTISDDDMEIISYYKQLSKIDQHWIVGQMIDIIKQSRKDNSNNLPVAADNKLKEAK